jgi:uncharacterized membrane protein YdjX (TVP38/TMEM64 family)
MRLLLTFLVFAAIVLIIFFLWGEAFAFMFTQDGAVQWLTLYGQWAWLVAIALLVSDIVLPLPATIIMSSLGYIYGLWVGGLLSAVGSFVSGSVGYWLCRLLGEHAAVRILGAEDYERGKRMSSRMGGLIVALSRWLPVFPEVIACMAGLTRMQPLLFHASLLCGSLPLGFTYAYIGYTGLENAILAIILSAGVPPVIWFLVRSFFRKHLEMV